MAAQKCCSETSLILKGCTMSRNRMDHVQAYDPYTNRDESHLVKQQPETTYNPFDVCPLALAKRAARLAVIDRELARRLTALRSLL